ncbi:MAG: VC0807 family protein [Akkermansia sp.]
MDATQRSLLNIVMSVLAPVLILSKCSESGDSFWQMGTTPALVVALALPIGYGIYNFWETRKYDALNLLGLLGVLFTAVVTVYATTGEGEQIRPNTPWWFAAKEAFIPLLMAVAVMLTAKSKGALLRVFLYSDAIFDVVRIEKKSAELNRTGEYEKCLWNASLMTASSLIFSSAMNFGLALYFLLPVLGLPAADQALAYNYAIKDLTWAGFIVISFPLLLTLFGVLMYLIKTLQRITGLTRDELLHA